MSIRDEVKAEQQRIFNERMEQRKKEMAKNPTNNNGKFGCGITLFIILLAMILIVINGIGSDSYDPNDWDFDGDVDYDDAEKKLDWILENEK